LTEFGNTATGALTAEEFETMELVSLPDCALCAKDWYPRVMIWMYQDDECDPPSFTRNEIEEKLRLEGLTPLMLENGGVPSGTSECGDDEPEESKDSVFSKKAASTKDKQELMYSQIEAVSRRLNSCGSSCGFVYCHMAHVTCVVACR
jgi:hypothetical protein